MNWQAQSLMLYDENDGLSKLGAQLDSIRRDLKYAINEDAMVNIN